MSACLAIGRMNDHLSFGKAVIVWPVEARMYAVEQEHSRGAQDTSSFSDHTAEVLDVRGSPGAHQEVEGLGGEGKALGVGLMDSGASPLSVASSLPVAP